LTQFPEADYRYLFSRLRRREGSRVPLRMRAASNPGGIGHDWVKQRFLIEGPAAGRVFVPARLDDNPHLDRQGYVASLNELDPVTRAQLLAGDWSVRHGGSIFRREWFGVVDSMPPNLRKVRAWDLAASEAKPGTDPDWAVGVLMGRSADSGFYILDVRRARTTPQGVENLVRQTAEQDGRDVPILMEQEPGSSGKSLVQRYARLLAGWPFYAERVTGDKVTRASPFSSQVEAGRVFLVRAAWNATFLDELEAFPHNASHDDQVDAASAAFDRLCQAPRTVDGPLLCYPSVEDAERHQLALDGEQNVMRFRYPCGHGYPQHALGRRGCLECDCPSYRGHVVEFPDDEPDPLAWRYGPLPRPF
jgi:predicted phage terminase large subunit-like protein